MKYLLCLTLVSLFLLNGCTETEKLEVEPSNPIAGVWQSTGDKTWQFVMKDDGSVSEVFLPDGLHMVISEEGTQKEISPEITEHYMYGPCRWFFDEDSNVLAVTLTYDKLLIRGDGAKLERTINDELTGQVSEDLDEWNPNWVRKISFSLPIPEQILTPVTYQFRKIE
jgi:hypothetical protein